VAVVPAAPDTPVFPPPLVITMPVEGEFGLSLEHARHRVKTKQLPNEEERNEIMGT
jgi:hypothetical protein